MLGLLKAKKPYVQNAKSVYSALLSHIRDPVFYEEYDVPDTFDGRFDLLLLHVYAVIDYMLAQGNEEQARDFNQELFDVTFADMDQTLREMGIGDMGMPKHMRRMMKAFNGRVHAYSAAVESGTLKESLRQNLYGTVDEVSDEVLARMEAYVLDMRRYMAVENALDDVLGGRIRLMDVG